MEDSQSVCTDGKDGARDRIDIDGPNAIRYVHVHASPALIGQYIRAEQQHFRTSNFLATAGVFGSFILKASFSAGFNVSNITSKQKAERGFEMERPPP